MNSNPVGSFCQIRIHISTSRKDFESTLDVLDLVLMGMPFMPPFLLDVQPVTLARAVTFHLI